MVGDWVYITDHPMKKEAKQVKPEHFLRSLVIFEPIQLTPEILEKNGFHKQDNYYVITDIPKANSFWNIKIRFATEHPTYVKRIEIGNVDGSDAININMSTIGSGKIYYVHELQHALKLCGIKKEIIL